VLGALEGRELSDVVGRAAALLAAVVGQDLDEGSDGVFRIARRVAKDRVISTVDPDARHGHKTAARGFDGYKGHVAVDPDSEIITATTVTAGNVGDGAAAEDLLREELAGEQDPAPAPAPAPADADADADQGVAQNQAPRLAVYGDMAYGTGDLLERLERADAQIMCKAQTPTAPGGRFAKDAFTIDQTAGTVTCPAGQAVTLTAVADGQIARFATACRACPLRAQCTTSAKGRAVRLGAHEAQLTRARARQQDPDWKTDYKATRPKIERKIAHLMRRKHGGRRARVRGKTKVGADFSWLSAATNLARMATLGLHQRDGGWATSTA
jgi:hypothetical protein